MVSKFEVEIIRLNRKLYEYRFQKVADLQRTSKHQWRIDEWIREFNFTSAQGLWIEAG